MAFGSNDENSARARHLSLGQAEAAVGYAPDGATEAPVGYVPDGVAEAPVG